MPARSIGIPALVLAAGLLVPSACAAGLSYQIVVEAGDHDRIDCPVTVLLAESRVQANLRPVELEAAASVSLTDAEGHALPAQLAEPSLLSGADQSGLARRELHFVVPNLKRGEKRQFAAVLSDMPAAGRFAWNGTPGEHADLSFKGRPVLRYMYQALDESSPQAREQTYKVFHHVFDFDGSRFLTKGAGGRYTHHRGLFFGFNRISYGDSGRVDTWHCSGKAHQLHQGFLTAEAGPVMGRHRVAIDWHGKEGETFVKEEREITVYEMPGGRLIEFASQLETTVGPVKLDGDPQHAGFQFRAAQEVADGDQKLTYYLRPDGKGGPGETRNWPGNQDFADLPWNALSFVLDADRYTAVYLDRPDNPKEARFSERTYGRFGSYFEYELTEDHPLRVRYRVWLQKGEITGEEAAALSTDFVDPPRVTVR